MCTVIVLLRPNHRYPLMLAANRDEHRKRPWDPPGRHWPDQPDVVAGRDRTAGGTWMGINRAGVVAAILNRAGTLGPILGKRSRGELPLLALRHATAWEAAEAVTRVDAGAWRDFNMVVADRTGAIFVRGLGEGRPTAVALPDGVSMVTAYDPNDPESPRVARHLPRLCHDLPDGPHGWSAWRTILADQSGGVGEQINVVPRGDFATVSSSFLTIRADGCPNWLFAAGPPHEAEFRPVALGRIPVIPVHAL
ncbi:MAG: NRDE family protein [Acetobacteraceae bacterium]